MNVSIKNKQARLLISLTLHCDLLANITRSPGLYNRLLSQRTEGGPVDGVGRGTTKGGNDDSGGNLHGRVVSDKLC